jgi:hypothetical protein
MEYDEARTFASSLPCTAGKSVMRERGVWRILSLISTLWEMESFIVWMIAGIAEREMACRVIR